MSVIIVSVLFLTSPTGGIIPARIVSVPDALAVVFSDADSDVEIFRKQPVLDRDNAHTEKKIFSIDPLRINPEPFAGKDPASVELSPTIRGLTDAGMELKDIVRLIKKSRQNYSCGQITAALLKSGFTPEQITEALLPAGFSREDTPLSQTLSTLPGALSPAIGEPAPERSDTVLSGHSSRAEPHPDTSNGTVFEKELCGEHVTVSLSLPSPKRDIPAPEKPESALPVNGNERSRSGYLTRPNLSEIAVRLKNTGKSASQVFVRIRTLLPKSPAPAEKNNPVAGRNDTVSTALNVSTILAAAGFSGGEILSALQTEYSGTQRLSEDEMSAVAALGMRIAGAEPQRIADELSAEGITSEQLFSASRKIDMNQIAFSEDFPVIGSIVPAEQLREISARMIKSGTPPAPAEWTAGLTAGTELRPKTAPEANGTQRRMTGFRQRWGLARTLLSNRFSETSNKQSDGMKLAALTLPTEKTDASAAAPRQPATLTATGGNSTVRLGIHSISAEAPLAQSSRRKETAVLNGSTVDKNLKPADRNNRLSREPEKDPEPETGLTGERQSPTGYHSHGNTLTAYYGGIVAGCLLIGILAVWIPRRKV